MRGVARRASTCHPQIPSGPDVSVSSKLLHTSKDLVQLTRTLAENGIAANALGQ